MAEQSDYNSDKQPEEVLVEEPVLDDVVGDNEYEEPEEPKEGLGEKIDRGRNLYDRIKEKKETPKAKPAPEAKKPPSEPKGEIGKPIGAPKPPPIAGAGGVGAGTGGTIGAGGAVGSGTGAVTGAAGAAGGTATVGATAWWIILAVVIILLIIAIVLFIAGVVVGIASGGGITNRSDVAVGYAGVGIQPELLYPSGCSDANIVKAIQEYIPKNSPLWSKAQYMVESAKKAGINPFLIVVQARKESSYATDGSLIDDFNPFGLKAEGLCGRRTESSAGAFAKFGSWEEAIDSYVNTSILCYFSKGDRTLEQIIYRYAPPEDNNNTSLYLTQAKEWLSDLYSLSGCSVGSATQYVGNNINVASDDGIIPFATQSMLSLTNKNIDQVLRRPSYIVIHFTGGDGDPRSGFQSGVNNNDGTMLPVKGSYRAYVHFYVDKSGNIYQLVPTNRSVRGAGGFNLLQSNGSVLKGINNINDIPSDATISIHIENQGANGSSLTDAQAKANAKIANFLMEKYGIPASNIIGHDEAYRLVVNAGADAGYGSERSNEPGESFMNKVRSSLNVSGMGGTASGSGVNCNDAIAGGATASEAMQHVNIDNDGDGAADGLNVSQRVVSDIENGSSFSEVGHVNPSPRLLGFLVLLDNFAETNNIPVTINTMMTGHNYYVASPEGSSRTVSNHGLGRAVDLVIPSADRTAGKGVDEILLPWIYNLNKTGQIPLSDLIYDGAQISGTTANQYNLSGGNNHNYGNSTLYGAYDGHIDNNSAGHEDHIHVGVAE